MREQAFNGARDDEGATSQGRSENELAQAHRTYRIDGENHPRVGFAEEPWHDSAADCFRECGARPGEYHVPGCEVEQCPVRVITCDCAYGGSARRTMRS